MKTMKRWLMKMAAVLGVVLILPVTAPATTTQLAMCLPTVDEGTFAYDAGPVRVVPDNALTDSAVITQPVPFFGPVGGLVAAKSPVLLNPPIKVAEKGLQHVVERHTVNDIAKFAGKSKFNPGEDLTTLIQRGTQQPMVPQGNRFVRTFDAGRTIGLDRATGQQTSIMTVVTEADGTLVTAFPGVP